MDRRDFLRSTLASAALVPFSRWQQADSILEQRRADMGKAPIVTTRLTDTLTLLSGPGGNVVVLNGADGKVVVDTFVRPAWTSLKNLLDQLGPAPIRTAIDTHWHFDHADNNDGFRKAGATVLAHANTTKRLSGTYDILGMHITPVPADWLPTQTFTTTHTITQSGEQVEVGYIPPAHTDTDIYVHFTRGNVLHLGDVFFNNGYPFIDSVTGGHIDGQIAGASLGLKLADNSTKIVPGHGPVADKGALLKYRDMMVTVRDRVRKLKTSGRTADEAVAAKPTADLDGVWGKAFMPPEVFVRIVYDTVK
jgi:cyclase